VASQALKALREGLDDECMNVKVAVAIAMVEHLQKTIHMCGADGDHVHRDAVSNALAIGPSFEIMQTEGGPTSIRVRAAELLECAKAGTAPAAKQWDESLRLVDVSWLDEIIRDGADAAHEKVHHITQWSKILTLKALYDPRNLHDDDVPKTAEQMTATYFGAIPGEDQSNFSLLMGQYKNFASAIARLSESDRHELKPARFWRDNAGTYPLLYKLGLWYASVPTSSVAAERSFGIMRAVEQPNKMAQKDPAWRAEIFLRYNKWLVDLKWQEAVALVTKMSSSDEVALQRDPYFGPH